MESDMDTTFICSAIDCDSTRHEAKGLCRKHYRRTQNRTPDKPIAVACDGCGTTIYRHKSKRYPRSFCSELCSHWVQHGPWFSPLPTRRRKAKQAPVHPPVPGKLVAGYCHDCGESFIAITTTGAAKYCSRMCATRSARRARRAREHNAPGTFRNSDIMRQYTRQGRVCAYCEQPCPGLPTPEHVVALSRGGRNDMSNLVAACHLCNSDKCDLSLEEWAADRAVRELPPVNTDLYNGDPRYTHLWRLTPQGHARRSPSLVA